MKLLSPPGDSLLMRALMQVPPDDDYFEQIVMRVDPGREPDVRPFVNLRGYILFESPFSHLTVDEKGAGSVRVASGWGFIRLVSVIDRRRKYAIYYLKTPPGSPIITDADRWIHFCSMLPDEWPRVRDVFWKLCFNDMNDNRVQHLLELLQQSD